MGTFVSYRRVSPRKDDVALSFEMQASAISKHVQSCGGVVIADYFEVASGKESRRVELQKALAHAKRAGATLVVSMLDRLSRKLSFITGLLDAGVKFVCCDIPNADRFTLHVVAMAAEKEGELISERTKEALGAAKARGVLLGSARPGHWDGREDKRLAGLDKARLSSAVSRAERSRKHFAEVVPLIKRWRSQGYTFQEITDKLGEAGYTTVKHKRIGRSMVVRLFRMNSQ